MSESVDKIHAHGGMDKDSDYPYIKKGDYVDALNIRHNSDKGQTGVSVQNVKGNTRAFILNNITVQNKTVAIYIDSNTVKTYAFKFYDLNNTLMADSGNVTLTLNNFSTSAASLQTAISVAFGTTYFVTSFSTNPIDSATGYLLVTIYADDSFGTQYFGFDYTVTSYGADETTISTVQEAIDSSVAGSQYVIGSYDIGDLFVFSTPTKNLPTEYLYHVAPGTTTSDSNNNILLQGADTQPWAVDDTYISLKSTQPFLNGLWLIAVYPGTGVVLLNSTYSAPTDEDVTITTHVNGYGQIGVAQEQPGDPSTPYLYTRLLGAKGLNFRLAHQIDCQIEADIYKTSVYFTDDYNFPRVFYYYGDYTTDGAIKYIDSQNIYEYDTIDAQVKLLPNSSLLSVSVVSQLEGGGHILAGNHRYAARLLTDTLSSTDWSDLCNPINVFNVSLSDNMNISGDDASTYCGKQNVLQITGIPPVSFKYIEICDVHYVDVVAPPTATIINRYLITGTTMTITHTGNETSPVDIDPATLNSKNADIRTAKNISIQDSRLVISNITSSDNIDFTEFAQTFTHALGQKSIVGVGDPNLGFYVSQEYADPNNVYLYGGYMLNEIYRFGAKFILKNGRITDTYWIDDIRFDTLLTNSIANPTSNRRTAGLPNYNLTNNSAHSDPHYNVLVPYVTFGSIDTSYILPGGLSVGDVVSEIVFERVEMVEQYREVLFSGIALPFIQDFDFTFVYNFTTVDAYYGSYPPSTNLGEFPFAAGYYLDSSVFGTVAPLYTNSVFNSHRNRKYLSLYSPDIYYGYTGFSFLSGDQILNYGNPNYTDHYSFGTQGSPNAALWLSTMNTFNGCTDNGTHTPPLVYSPLNIDDAAFLHQGGSATISGTSLTKHYELNGEAPGTSPWQDFTTVYHMAASPVVHVTTDATNGGDFSDFGVYQFQYYRFKSTNGGVSKFGATSDSTYIPTGARLSILNQTGVLTQDIFGGDVFTQRSWFKQRIPQTTITGYGSEKSGFGGGIAYISQNRVNAQMRNVFTTNTSIEYEYPHQTAVTWLENVQTSQPLLDYNFGYNYQNGISADVSFNENVRTATDMPVRIYWSDSKPQDSLKDDYRSIPPLNFHDLDLTDGEIVHHAECNGELVTWQPYRFMRQYFNNRGELQMKNDTQGIVIGDGSVMSRDGQTNTVVGSKHKWAIIRGNSEAGKDVFYWIDTSVGKVMRFGADGSRCISDEGNMASFFANNVKWVDLYDSNFAKTWNLDTDNPASGSGLCGVWDDRNAEALWTARAINGYFIANNAWNGSTTYVAGDYVWYGTSGYYSIPVIYQCILGVNSNASPDIDTTHWAAVKDTQEFYNYYTVCFNEEKNKFTTFYSFKPKIYLQWQDTFLSPNPVKDEEVFIHNQGDWNDWYELICVPTGQISIPDIYWNLLNDPTFQNPSTYWNGSSNVTFAGGYAYWDGTGGGISLFQDNGIGFPDGSYTFMCDVTNYTTGTCDVSPDSGSGGSFTNNPVFVPVTTISSIGQFFIADNGSTGYNGHITNVTLAPYYNCNVNYWNGSTYVTSALSPAATVAALLAEAKTLLEGTGFYNCTVTGNNIAITANNASFAGKSISFYIDNGHTTYAYAITLTCVPGSGAEDGYITIPYAVDENNIKLWLATLVNSVQSPYLVELYTKNHESYLDSTDFSATLDQFSSAIKNDILTSSTGAANDEDTSQLYGQYLLQKYYFHHGEFQKYVDWVIKYLVMKRNYRK